MVPWKDGKANHGHSCVKGRFAWGYANHRDRILKPMVRAQDHRSVARSVVGRGDRPRRHRVQAHPGEIRQRLDRRHHLVALHRRRDLSGAEAGPRRVRQQQCRYLRARLPFADRLRPEQDLRHLGRHAGFQFGRPSRRHHGDRRQPDRRASGLRVAHEKAAAPGRQADRRRSAPHRPRAHAACRGAVSSAAAARHQCRDAQCAGACRSSPKDWSTKTSCASAAIPTPSPTGSAFVSRPREQPRSRRRNITGVPAADIRARGAALCHRRQWRDLLRPRRHRAQPGHHRRHGHGQSRDGDRQYRPARRRRESAPRPEQRSGLVRHGLVPARTFGLSPYLRREDPRAVRDGLGRASRIRSRACASPICSMPPSTARSGHLHPGRGHPAIRSRHASCRRRPRGDGMRRGAGPVPERDRELRACVPAGLDLPRKGRHLHQCRAAHRQRAQGDAAHERLRRLGNHRRDRQGDGHGVGLYPPVARSWTRSRA